MSMFDDPLNPPRYGVEVMNGINGGYNVFYSGLTKIGAKRVANKLNRESIDCTARINSYPAPQNDLYPWATRSYYRAVQYDYATRTYKPY